METTGFVEADFERFLRTEELKRVRLQRIWHMDGFIQFAATYVNRKRLVERLIDLPHALQRALVAFDGFLSRFPLLRGFCWHWTLVAQRPQTNNGL